MKYLLLISLLVLPGCSTSFGRFFQAKVPTPITKPAETIEAERRSADLIARTIETPVELKPIAYALSQSLGTPKVQIKALTVADLPAAFTTASRELQAGQLSQQQQIVELNKKLAKYAGKEIEDTGISLLGPGMATIVVAMITLGVVFPPAFTIMGIMYRRLKQTTSMIVDQIDVAAKAPETQQAVSALKVELSKKMDMAHKKVVSSLQKL